MQVEDLNEVFEIYDKRWKKRFESSGFTDPVKRAFFESLFNEKSKVFHLEINKLKFEDTIIGFTIYACCRDRKTCYRIGHDPDFHLFGPGSLIIYKDLQKTKASNVKVLDYCNGYEAYKVEWSTHLDFTR